MKTNPDIILLIIGTILLSLGQAGQSWARTITFDTTQVTTADVTVSPDGQTLVFTMLGHLFSLPSAGGQAKQLTFGPYYDNDPTFSSDGSQIAFQSDRDGSSGNIFLLRLTDSKLVQLTRSLIRRSCKKGRSTIKLTFENVKELNNKLI